MIDFDDLAEAETAWNPDDLVARARRSARERERPPASWAPKAGGSTPDVEAAESEDGEGALGVLYGLSFPTTADELVDCGPEWLNEAFQAAGTLPDGVQVSAVRGVHVLSTSRFVRRLRLEVEYWPSWCTLHRELLVKLPAPGSTTAPESQGKKDAFVRQRAGQQLAELSAHRLLQLAEINSYRLLEEVASLRMPRYYFGDVGEGTTDFIFIAEYMRPLDSLRTLREKQEATGFSLGLQFFRLQGVHGGSLSCNGQGQVFVDVPRQSNCTLWTLQPVPDDLKRRAVVSESGFMLATKDAGEQALHLTVSEQSDGAKWTLAPVPGEESTYYLRSSHGTYMASLDDKNQSLYMSPTEGEWERWVVRAVEDLDDDTPQQDTPQQEEWAAGDGSVVQVDLRSASLHTYSELIRAGARMAGMYKAGRFGPPAAVDQSFGSSTSKRAARRQGPILGLGKDHDFIEKVTTAQSFIQNVGKALLPGEVTTAEAMKAFRAVITSARHNLAQIDWWCNYRRDYVALGPGAFEVESVFAVGTVEEGASLILGLCDWTTASVTSLGQKLWQWLSCADHQVLERRLADLLSLFVETYAESGGPRLDLQLLRLHFVLAAAVELVRLLDEVPRICQQCPSDQWESITSFSDKRLSGPVWRVVRVLTNAAVVMTQSEIMSELEEVMTRVRIGYLMGAFVAGQAKPAYFTAARKAVEVRGGPGTKQLLLCRLPACMLVCAACEGGALPTSGDYVRLLIPVPGWALLKDLQPAKVPAPEGDEPVELREDFGDPCWRSADSMMLTLMYETRRQWTGRSPLHMCATSTRKLLEAIELREVHQKLQTHLGRGTCQQVVGSFLAETTAHTWWPKGYQGWCHHVFLRFEDGSIADVTADQWDKHVPQLWWPADKSRYTLTSREADNAREVRRMVGMDRWKELDSGDALNSVFKTRRRWTELEGLLLNAEQHVQPDPYTADASWRVAVAA